MCGTPRKRAQEEWTCTTCTLVHDGALDAKRRTCRVCGAARRDDEATPTQKENVPPAATATQANPPSKNAFSALMGAATQPNAFAKPAGAAKSSPSPRTETFVLDLTSHNEWSWEWRDGIRTDDNNDDSAALAQVGLRPNATTPPDAVLPRRGGGVPVPHQPRAPEVRIVAGAALAALAATAPASRPYNNPLLAVIKSALQKQVRLRRPAEAARCARALFRMHPFECARRLIVVAIEDAVLHPALPMLAWMLAAFSKGFPSVPALETAVADIAQDLATCPYVDHVDLPADAASRDAPHAAPEVDVASAEEHGTCFRAHALLRSLDFRRRYGGMTGDVAMLLNAQRKWFDRFAGRWAMPPPTGIAPEAYDGATHEARGAAWLAFASECHSAECAPPDANQHATGVRASGCAPMRMGDVPTSAVDFHICNIDEHLIDHVPEVRAACEAVDAADPRGVLRRALWLHRSAVTDGATRDVTGATPASAIADAARVARAARGAAAASLANVWAVAAAPAERYARDWLERKGLR